MNAQSTPENAQPSSTIGSIQATEQDMATRTARWKDEIANAEQEVKKWHEQGRKIIMRYKDDRKGAIDTLDSKFNLFTTNVGIMQAALYSKIPKVAVTRRFFDANDDVARVAANIMQRAITQDLDETHCDFSQVMEDAIEDRLVPGMGTAWLRMKVETDQIPVPVAELPWPEPGMDIPEPAEAEPEMMEVITNQEIIVEHVHWEDFLWSPCRTWAERRWVARKVYMDKDSITARFGEEIAKALPMDYTPKSKADGVVPVNDVLKKAVVYEIWDRTTRKVVWMSKSYEKLLDERDDPLGLEGFEPCPKPLFALTTTSNCLPTPDYYLLQDQYKELDDVNDRITMLHRACKVVGVYDKGADGVQRMLSEGSNNQLIPVDNWAMFAEKGGIKGTVDWLPLDSVINALQNLRQAREDIKGQIYELNGISDVVRGASKASETLGAQQIKANFANIRIQRQQAEVAMFASEIFRIKAELLAKHFTPEIIIKISGIEFTEDAQDPNLIAQAMELVKNEEEFEWRVSVDSDSMKMADYAAEKQERSEFVTSVATYLQSSATILQQAPEASPLLLGMLKYACAGYSGSKDIESLIDKFVDQTEQKLKPQPDPEQQKMEAEMQMEQQRFQMEQQGKQADQQINQQTAMQDLQIKQADAQIKAAADEQKLQFEREKFQQEMVFAQAEHEQQMAFEREKFEMEIAMKQQDAALNREAKAQEASDKQMVIARESESSGHMQKMMEMIKKAMRPRVHTLEYDDDGMPVRSVSKVREDDDE